MLSQDKIYELRKAAEAAWGDDTRHPAYQGSPQPSAGQCYVTSRWLTHQLGGDVGQKSGHYFWVSPDQQHGLDLTGDQFAFKPRDPALEGTVRDDEDTGLKYDRLHKVHRPGPVLYKTTDHHHFKDFTLVPPPEKGEHPRVQSFMRRANAALASKTTRTALDLAGDAFPGEEPQQTEDTAQENRYWHDEPDYTPGSGEYKFVYGNGQLHLDPNYSHEELSQTMGIAPDHTGPFAVGHVVLNMGKATWEVQGNVSPRALVRVFKDYCKHVGWEWGGLTDITGEPIGTGSEFGPKKSVWYAYNIDEDHLYIGSRVQNVFDKGDHVGVLHLEDKTARVRYHRPKDYVREVLQEWADDHGLTLVAGNDNVMKTIEDLQTENIYTPNQNERPEPRVDERQPGGVYRCPKPGCGQIFPTWHLYQEHRMKEEPMGDREPVQDSGMKPLPDMDDQLPAGFIEQERPYVINSGVKEAQRVDGWRGIRGWKADPGYKWYVAYSHGSPIGYAAVDDSFTDGRAYIEYIRAARSERVVKTAIVRLLQARHTQLIGADPILRYAGFIRTGKTTLKWAKGTDPRDLLEAAVPFVYDVEDDNITVGHPGTRHSDIPGKFTPGGIVEGTYEPGGKVIIRSMTTIPYTVRHLLELWYYEYPHMEIRSVHLRDDTGRDTRLAATDVGGYIASLVSAEPSTLAASQALAKAGGHVYVVGGAVRDALVGKEPKDLDLMVTGVPSEDIRKALEALPGETYLTGKDFGVYRYKSPQGGEVEVTLPRRERSTGGGHKDFDVQADHTMKPEEDLYRRDFTPNAMAVDLNTGHIVDPFGGADDIQQGKYRTLNEKSLSDDPLRTLRGLGLTSRFGLEPDERTRSQMQQHAGKLINVPNDRIQPELDKIFSGDDPARAVQLAHNTGVLKYILPEVDAAFGYSQDNKHHEQELGDHLLSVLRHVSERTTDPDVRIAALLHDIGKPGSRWTECSSPECAELAPGNKRPIEGDTCPECGSPGEGHFYEWMDPSGKKWGKQHELYGADLAEDRLRALRYPENRIKRVSELVQHHMFPGFVSERGARRFLNRVGDHADDLLTLRIGDQGGKSIYPTNAQLSVDAQQQLLDNVREQGQPTNQQQLAVNGYDIMQATGRQPGAIIGEVLRHLTQDVVEDPSLNNRDELLRRAQDYTSDYAAPPG